jgi:xylose isomerase
MIDTSGQIIHRSKEELLKHLKTFKLELKFSAGVWFFYPGPGRFHEPYIERGSIEDILNKVAWMYDNGLVDKTFRLEAHYPNEINWDNLHLYKSLEKETGIKVIMVSPNLFYEKKFEFGSFSSPIDAVRRESIKRTIESMKLAKEIGAEFIVIWTGAMDGYENPLGVNFYYLWERYESGLAEAIDEVPGMPVALEPKPYEPRGNTLYRNTANGILLANYIERRLRNPENRRLLEQGYRIVGLNPEVGHIFMGYEELSLALASIMREGRLFHTHWNSQPLGNYDQDLDVGVLGWNEMVSALLTLKMYGYRGYFGIDINPERIPVETALTNTMNAIKIANSIIERMDYDRLIEAFYNPAENRGVIEDVYLRAIAPPGTELKPIPKTKY